MKARVVPFAITLVSVMFSMALGARVRTTAPVPAMTAIDARAVLDRYCVTCHNQRLKSGSLALDTIDVEHAGEDPAIWEKVVRKLRGGLMPPAGRPRPDAAMNGALVGNLEMKLDAAAAAHPNPGRPETLRRLNRTEYRNAIRDLLALDLDVSAFVPADDSAFGFDNIGGVFKLSPALMESYLSAAGKISAMAMGTTAPDQAKMYGVSRRLQQHDQIEGQGFGTRGGTVIHHLFPQDGEYAFKIYMGLMAIITEPHTMELTIDGVQVKAFNVVRVGSAPESQFFGDREVAFDVRVPVAAGPHNVGVTFYKNSSAIPEFIYEPFQISSASNFAGGNPGVGGEIPVVNAVSIGGPFDATGPGDTASRRRILTCHPAAASEEAACASKIISTLARRAFRRPLMDADVKPLMAFYTDWRNKGDGFEVAIEKVLRRVLASPKFLFRAEVDPPEVNKPSTVAVADGRGLSIYRISDLELASRLSFFVWSSIPDDRLVDLAAHGQLRQPEVLGRELHRLIADRRSDALTTSFASQWLQLRRLESVRPGGEYGKNFDESLKRGLRRETELFFDSIVREDRPVAELITADYSFMNERVAEHYGIHEVQGTDFRRVALPANNPRRGLLGQGSVLTLTAQASAVPVTRGKYILETLLGTPPPPPPPNVPALPEKKIGDRPKTMRERMAAHRSNPVCATCHSMIDPLGFSLENFDAVGVWREFDDGSARIDPSGVMPDGRPFGNLAELRTLLTADPEQLATTFTEKLLTYALGRGLEPYDMPVVRKIVHEAADHEYRVQSIILGVVNSYPFQMRNASQARPASVASR
jgi:hypothetical protein